MLHISAKNDQLLAASKNKKKKEKKGNINNKKQTPLKTTTTTKYTKTKQAKQKQRVKKKKKKLTISKVTQVLSVVEWSNSEMAKTVMCAGVGLNCVPCDKCSLLSYTFSSSMLS